MKKFEFSPAGLQSIRHDEKLMLDTYLCSAGKNTIGYGHTGRHAMPGRRITPQIAELILREDAATARDAVNRAVTSNIGQAQFDALGSFTFNAGVGALGQSTLLKVVNANPADRTVVDIAKITDKPQLRDYLLSRGVKSCDVITYNFLKWIWHENPKTKKKEISNGLFNRRRREAALYWSAVNK